MQQFDVIVIGAGAMGCAAAYHLAKDNQRVLLLEQFEIGHTRGSSHGESRIFRFAYPQPDYARLAMQTKPLWRALEDECGEPLLLDSGGVDIADDPSGFPQVREVIDTLTKLGARHEVLHAGQFAARFPQFRIGPEGYAVYSPDAGILRADQCVRAMARMAARHGAAIHERESAQRVHTDGDSVEVITSKGRFRARKAIVTAGAWVNQLLEASGYPTLPVRIEREQVAYFDTRGDARMARGQWLIWIHYRSQIVYGFPDLGSGVKAGFHHAGHYIAHPDDNAGPLNADDLRALGDYVRERFPSLDPTPRNGLSCLYTVTPDEDFIIDPLPSAPNVILASPCSGHGFKFAVGIGRALADLALHGETEMSIAHTRKLTTAH